MGELRTIVSRPGFSLRTEPGCRILAQVPGLPGVSWEIAAMDVEWERQLLDPRVERALIELITERAQTGDLRVFQWRMVEDRLEGAG